MKKQFLFLVWLLPFVILCSCQQDEQVVTPVETETETTQSTTTENATAYSRALDNVFDLMREVYPEKHKALVSTKHLLKPEYYTTATLAMTRPDAVKMLSAKYETGDHEIPLDTLLYIVNFGNDEGFAIMYAVENNGNDVIAITERGSLTIEDLTRDYSDLPEGICDLTPRATIAGLVNNGAWSFKDGNVPPVGGDTGGYPNVIPYPYTTYGPWENDETIVEPITKEKYHQRDPYNFYCPQRGDDKAPVGCVAVALMHIMSAHNYPQYINGYQGSWRTASDDLLAHWAREIGRICHMNYGAEGSGSTIYYAKQCLKKFDRYRDVTINDDPDMNKIRSMLQCGSPVYCRGKETKNHLSGHAWVVDGLFRQKRKVREVRNATTVFDMGYSSFRTLVHCSFGWEYALFDGYYVIDCFNISDGAIIKTGPTQKSEECDFNYNTKFMTYSFW